MNNLEIDRKAEKVKEAKASLASAREKKAAVIELANRLIAEAEAAEAEAEAAEAKAEAAFEKVLGAEIKKKFLAPTLKKMWAQIKTFFSFFCSIGEKKTAPLWTFSSL